MNYAELLHRPIFDPVLTKDTLTCDYATRDIAIEQRFVSLVQNPGARYAPIEKMARQSCKLDRVLITGACGTIGSSLIGKLEGIAGRIYAADRNERALAEMPKSDTVHPCLLDVTDRTNVIERIRLWQPQMIIHCAAYKHVPLMEFYTMEAINNNVNGTKNVIDGMRYTTRDARFILISTDKAASRSTVMGCTKYLAERYVQSCQSSWSRTLHIVRFGNVLGSSGSVIEIWERQLEAGEPLTVTTNASRFFCTIDEAAAFALYCSANVVLNDPNACATLALNMGEPIEMEDLAKRFLAFKGVPEYQLELIGLRPGDQQTEVLAGIGEEIRRVAVASG